MVQADVPISLYGYLKITVPISSIQGTLKQGTRQADVPTSMYIVVWQGTLKRWCTIRYSQVYLTKSPDVPASIHRRTSRYSQMYHMFQAYVPYIIRMCTLRIAHVYLYRCMVGCLKIVVPTHYRPMYHIMQVEASLVYSSIMSKHNITHNANTQI